MDRAVLVLEDMSWTVQSLLEKHGLKGLNFSLVADREVWASVRAELSSAGAENRTVFKYIDFTAKQMLPPYISAEEFEERAHSPVWTWMQISWAITSRRCMHQ